MLYTPNATVEAALLKAEEQLVRGIIGLEQIQANWEWRATPHPHIRAGSSAGQGQEDAYSEFLRARAS